MARHVFTLAERWGVFAAHGTKQGTRCWLCTEPLDFANTDIDHLLPEDLLNDAAELQRVLAAYGLPPNFDLNSFENWLPAHSICNRKKRDHVFRPTPIIQLHIERARARASVARQQAEGARRNGEISKAIGTLATGPKALPKELVAQVVQHYASANSSAEVIRTEIKVPGKGKLGWATTEEVIGFIPPAEVRLAPNIKIFFDQEAQPTANSYFPFRLTAPSE
jgi:hypothetical protein